MSVVFEYQYMCFGLLLAESGPVSREWKCMMDVHACAGVANE